MPSAGIPSSPNGVATASGTAAAIRRSLSGTLAASDSAESDSVASPRSSTLRSPWRRAR